MKCKIVSFALALCFIGLLSVASANPRNPKDDAVSAAAGTSGSDKDLRLEGEKRFHSNCSRCHAAPPRFSPRMTGTIIRHMRVRAMLTDEEARLILRYMSQ